MTLVKSQKVVCKNPYLVIGPTGSGEDFPYQTLARSLDMPLCIADATALTEAEFMLVRTWKIFSSNSCRRLTGIERAERGIIYVDEIDKIAKEERERVYHLFLVKRVQQAPSSIEGTVASVPPQGERKHPQQMIQVDKNILFYRGGAFDGIEELSNSVWVKK